MYSRVKVTRKVASSDGGRGSKLCRRFTMKKTLRVRLALRLWLV